MGSVEFDHLVRDANVIAWYAARHGKLPDGSQIFTLIETVRTAGLAEPNSIAALCTEMKRVAKEIGGIRTSLLIQRWSFVDILRRALVAIAPFLFGLFTILLTLYVAFQNSELTKADTAIREYQEWTSRQSREKLYAAWKMYHYEQVLKIKGPPLDQLDSYQRLVDEITQAANKGDAVMHLLAQSADVRYLPKFLDTSEPNITQQHDRELNFGSSADTLDPDQVSVPQEKYSLDPECNDSALAKPREKARIGGARQPAAIDEYANSYNCFLKQLRISTGIFIYPSTWETIFSVRLKINMMVAWLLPGLYGLLGACVYLLREFMRRDNGSLTTQKQIVGMLLQVLRVALGGLSGIIIGWFWVPIATPNNGTIATTISAIPFGLAFMAGFSIDTLFSLLERIRRMIDTGEKNSIKINE